MENKNKLYLLYVPAIIFLVLIVVNRIFGLGLDITTGTYHVLFMFLGIVIGWMAVYKVKIAPLLNEMIELEERAKKAEEKAAALERQLEEKE